MKKIIYYILFFGFVFLILGYLANREVKEIQEIKRHPIMYSYYKYSSSKVTISLASKDKECMLKIKEYYNAVEQGEDPYLPACFEHGIRPRDSVYVLLLDADSVYAKVAVFYRAPNGKKKHFVGYVFKETLHDKPYSL
jgi:hypothetical protein